MSCALLQYRLFASMLSYTNLLKFERQRDVKGKVSSQLIQRPNNYAEW